MAISSNKALTTDYFNIREGFCSGSLTNFTVNKEWIDEIPIGGFKISMSGNSIHIFGRSSNTQFNVLCMSTANQLNVVCKSGIVPTVEGTNYRFNVQ